MKTNQKLFNTREGESGLSRMAEGIAIQRFAETLLPEGVRIFSDPYAVHFIDPATLSWANEHPEERKALAVTIERKMPGWSNAIRARIRYFDDIVQEIADNGFTQLVILGAGYDTRVIRFAMLKDRVRVFEIDRQETQARKIDILTEILGQTPAHITFIPLDIAQEDCWETLARAGWSPAEQTLFLLEGLVMYLPRPVVDHLLSGIAVHGGAGSAVLFDFMPPSVADGSSDAEGGQFIREWTKRAGEPILSGFSRSEVVSLLTRFGFTGVRVVASHDFAGMYYKGRNAERTVSGLMSVVYATVRGPGDGPV